MFQTPGRRQDKQRGKSFEVRFPSENIEIDLQVMEWLYLKNVPCKVSDSETCTGSPHFVRSSLCARFVNSQKKFTLCDFLTLCGYYTGYIYEGFFHYITKVLTSQKITKCYHFKKTICFENWLNIITT